MITSEALFKCITTRKSIRAFLADKIVDQSIIDKCLQAAQYAPSNCNTQPWRVFLAKGDAKDQLKKRVLKI